MFNKVSQVKKNPLATTNSYVPFIPSSNMTITGCCRDHLLIKIKLDEQKLNTTNFK